MSPETAAANRRVALGSLEQTMDQVGPAEFLAMVAEILEAKADHLQTNWQDARMASKFSGAASHVTKAMNAVDVAYHRGMNNVD